MSADEFEVIELSEEELRALLARLKPSAAPEDYKKLEYLADTHIYLTQLLAEKGMTIQKLRKLFISPFKSEKLRDVLPETENGPDAEKISEPEKGLEPPEAEAKPEGSEQSGNAAPAGDLPAAGEDEKNDEGPPEDKPKGHGRNGADEYEGAERIQVPHESLKRGDPCPDPGCKGKVYEYFRPAVLVRLVGQAPVAAKVIELQQFRCNLCLEVYTARAPEGVSPEKYDETAASIIALLRYGTGLPFTRLERLQKNFGIPLPASTQWDIVERGAKLVEPAHKALIHEAAQGDVLYSDDTPMKVLALMKENEERKADDG